VKTNVEWPNFIDLGFINSQKNNRYSPSNCPPFLVHIESVDGNIRPMRLGKLLAEHFPAINNIRRLGRNIIAVNFKFSFDANNFVQSDNLLPENWIPYIPNYKIIRTGVVRGVDPSLSIDEILQVLKWRDRPMEVRSIERLKFRDMRNNNELKESNSIKIDFVSNLLPEFISIWNVKSKVRPYINKIRKCYNCFKWGHSSTFCRNSSACSGCGFSHESEDCSNESFNCPDCKQLHAPFETICPIFRKYEIVNAVMAYCNVSQFIAKKQIKINNICNLEPVERVFKSSAYLAWNNVDILSGHGVSEDSSTHSVVSRKLKYLTKRKLKSNRLTGTKLPDGGQNISEDFGDSTLVPEVDGMSREGPSREHCSSVDSNYLNNDRSNEDRNVIVPSSNIENLFPSPGVIIKDIYELYKGSESRRERDLAVLNYLNLLFGNSNL